MSDDQPPVSLRARLFDKPESSEHSFIAAALRTETVGGAVLLLGATIALVWANIGGGTSYDALRAYVPLDRSLEVGPLSFALDLSLAGWAADGLLAVFFFIVGLELKREFVAGSLRNPRQAAIPVLAAVGGMIVPAAVFLLVTFPLGADAMRGWAIPSATDIAFALAVLAVIGSHLPSALRVFLLTLAVVDDLLAVVIIAIVYTEQVQVGYLLGGLVPLALFALLVQRRVTSPWLLIPLALITWLFVHESGVHATIAGVLLGFTVPVLRRGREGVCLAQHLEHVWRPVSAGFAIPVYAFFAAGVNLTEGGIAEVFRDRVAIGVMLGLVVGKVVGVLGTTYLLARFTRAELDDDLAWPDVLGVAQLAGIGFTVSLLIDELAFGEGSQTGQNVVAAILFGSLISAVLASITLGRRNRVYRKIEERDREEYEREAAEQAGAPGVAGT